MRLTPEQATAIREEVGRADPGAEVYLHGARADDAATGGDIDLLVISDKLSFPDMLVLRIRILDRIGWQQLDLQVRRPEEMEEPFAALARQTGVKL